MHSEEHSGVAPSITSLEMISTCSCAENIAGQELCQGALKDEVAFHGADLQMAAIDSGIKHYRAGWL